MILRNVLRRACNAAHQVQEAAELASSLAWFLADHVRRLLTGRPSLLEEAFGQLDFDIVEDDIMPPYGDRDRPAQETQPQQLHRGVNGKGKP